MLTATRATLVYTFSRNEFWGLEQCPGIPRAPRGHLAAAARAARFRSASRFRRRDGLGGDRSAPARHGGALSSDSQEHLCVHARAVRCILLAFCTHAKFALTALYTFAVQSGPSGKDSSRQRSRKDLVRLLHIVELAPYTLALAPSRGAAPQRSRVRRRYTQVLPCASPDC